MTTDPQHPYGTPAPAYGTASGDVPGGYAHVPGAQRERFAHWGQRVGATIIDSFVVAIVPWIFFVYAIVTSETPATGGDPVPSAAGGVALAIGSVLYLAIWIWNRLHRQGTTGQSVGKKIMNIRLVAEATGQPIGMGRAFLREIAHIADAPFYLGYLWPLWDDKRQTFSDKIMTTVVVRDGAA